QLIAFTTRRMRENPLLAAHPELLGSRGFQDSLAYLRDLESRREEGLIPVGGDLVFNPMTGETINTQTGQTIQSQTQPERRSIGEGARNLLQQAQAPMPSQMVREQFPEAISIVRELRQE